ncbi:hypothetical protein MMC10_000124 [Thelotrema lepadinum]|nr:hypothetical protein [Thelotrema lepadinum]
MASNALSDYQNVTAAGFNLSANVLSFITAATNAISTGSPVLKFCHDLVRWIARERLSETEFDYCITLMQGLVVPNERGLEIRKKLALDSDPQSLCGLRLTSAGSIGRMLAWNPDFVYMVTTVAALMTYHRPEDAVEVLCCMATQVQVPSGHQQDPENRWSSPYSPQKARVRPVVTKIVESIAFNIVNLGKDLSTLTEDLKDYCVHVMPAPKLAEMVIGVVREREQDLVVYSSRLYGDFLAWVFAHYSGTVQVSIEGKITYERKLGDSATRLMYFVRDGCTVNENSHLKSKTIEMSVAMGKSFKTIFKNRTLITQKMPEPTQRQSLYPAEKAIHSFGHDVLRHQHVQDIGVTAQVFAEWLLEVPLCPIIPEELFFGVMLDGSEEVHGDRGLSGSQIKTFAVGQLLRQWPSIGHLKLGSLRKARSVFKSADLSAHPSIDDLVLSVEEMVSSFPILQDLLEDLQRDCHCHDCRKGSGVGKFKAGCLQERGWIAFCLLLAHTIADGFGAPDASGLTDPHALAILVQNLLSELVVQRKVSWDKWFALAATVFLGCPTGFAIEDDHGKTTNYVDQGASALVAIQFGSLVVASSWVDLTRELRLEGCFGLEIAEGNLHGVPQDFAIVQAEATMNSIVNARDLILPTLNLDSEGEATSIPHSISQLFDLSKLDDCELAYQTAIVGGADIPYRLLTMVQSGKHIRVVDPSRAVLALAWSLAPACQHRSEDQKPLEVEASALQFRSYSIDSIVASWPSSSGALRQIHSTLACNSHLKLNVALSVCGGICAIRTRDTCVACTIECLRFSYENTFRIINVNMGSRAVAIRHAGGEV